MHSHLRQNIFISILFLGFPKWKTDSAVRYGVWVAINIQTGWILTGIVHAWLGWDLFVAMLLYCYSNWRLQYTTSWMKQWHAQASAVHGSNKEACWGCPCEPNSLKEQRSICFQASKIWLIKRGTIVIQIHVLGRVWFKTYIFKSYKR